MFYEEIKCAFISLQPHPVKNTSIIENMSGNEQGELAFRSAQNDWIDVWLKFLKVIKFQQRIDMGNQSKISLDVKDVQNTVTLLLCKIQNLQESTTTCSSWIQYLQDPAESSLSKIQGP